MKEGLVRGEGFAADASLIEADAQRQNAVPGSEVIDWENPQEAARLVKEYLSALEEASPPLTHPTLTDPSTSWTAAQGPAYFAYCTNYLIDLDAGLILDLEASAVSGSAEARATRIMIDRVEAKYDIKPKRLVDDTNYGAFLGVRFFVLFAVP